MPKYSKKERKRHNNVAANLQGESAELDRQKINNKNKKKQKKSKRRCYGYYKCSECQREWESANSWADTWQLCKTCVIKIIPYKLEDLQKSVSNRLPDNNKEHPQELCGMCQKLGRNCRTQAVLSYNLESDYVSSESDEDGYNIRFQSSNQALFQKLAQQRIENEKRKLVVQQERETKRLEDEKRKLVAQQERETINNNIATQKAEQSENFKDQRFRFKRKQIKRHKELLIEKEEEDSVILNEPYYQPLLQSENKQIIQERANDLKANQLRIQAGLTQQDRYQQQQRQQIPSYEIKQQKSYTRESVGQPRQMVQACGYPDTNQIRIFTGQTQQDRYQQQQRQQIPSYEIRQQQNYKEESVEERKQIVEPAQSSFCGVKSCCIIF